MKIEKISKKISLIVIAVLIFSVAYISSASSVHAAPQYNWSVSSKKYVGDVNKGEKEYIKKHIVRKTGEKMSASYSVTKSGFVEGRLEVTTARLQGALGFNYSKTVKKTGTSYSAAGKKGQVIRAYGQRTYAKYKVVQKKTWYAHLHRKPEYKTIYVYKHILPDITFTYKNK